VSGGLIRASVAAAFACGLSCVTATPPRAAEQFRADDWVSECEGARFGAGCSIMVPFGQRSMKGVAGAFALAVDVESGMVAIVGKPPPLAATLQIDKNPPLRCTGPQYCIFSAGGSLTAVQQLAAGSIALIDVATREGPFHFSLGTQGFHAGLAKIKAWRSPVVGRTRPAK
jgi:hypothetical protein